MKSYHNADYIQTPFINKALSSKNIFDAGDLKYVNSSKKYPVLCTINNNYLYRNQHVICNEEHSPVNMNCNVELEHGSERDQEQDQEQDHKRDQMYVHPNKELSTNDNFRAEYIFHKKRNSLKKNKKNDESTDINAETTHDNPPSTKINNTLPSTKFEEDLHEIKNMLINVQKKIQTNNTKYGTDNMDKNKILSELDKIKKNITTLHEFDVNSDLPTNSIPQSYPHINDFSKKLKQIKYTIIFN